MKNLSVAKKFLLIMGLFGVFTLGVVYYVASSIAQIDTAYNGLVNEESKAAVSMSRANRTLQATRAAIGDLMMSHTVEGNTRMIEEINKYQKDFVSFADTAADAMPNLPAIPLLKAEGLKVVNEACGPAVLAGRDATTREALDLSQDLFLATCKPAFDAISPQFSAATKELVEASNAESQALSRESDRTILITVSSVVAGFVLVAFIGFIAVRAWLVNPLNELSATMALLAEGDLTVQVDNTGRSDEVGTMAKAVEVFKTNGIKAAELKREAESARTDAEGVRAEQADADRSRAIDLTFATSNLATGLKLLSEGDLTARIAEPFAVEYEGLRTDFNAAAQQLSEILRAVSVATASIDSGSREMSQSADDLSKRTEQQAASLEETAAALEQITTNVANSSKRTEEARNVAVEANASAKQSGEVVSSAVNAMQRIEASSSQISNIIGVIDEIAFQTNLLALNAGVEAARAGDAGRGFAVVAQEVRELAQRSAKAAKEIKDLIRNSTTEVENGVKLVQDTGVSLQVIEAHVVSINMQLEAIATSSREQAVGLSEVNTAVNQMDQVTQQNAAMVEEATAASATLSQEAMLLRDMVSKFKLEATTAKLVAIVSSHEPRHARLSPARRMVAGLSRAMKPVGG